MLPVILAAAALLASPTTPSQRATPVPVGVAPARMSLLTSGVRRYVRYTIKNGRRSPTDLWTRTVSYEPHEGARRLHIVQEWASDGTPSYTIDQDAWFDATNFRPLTHVRTIHRDGKTLIGGYPFEPSEIVGMKDLPGNTRADFRVASPEPAFNFELDMELLQVLPWRRGYVAEIVFYDPGQEPPAHYRFQLAGEDKIAGPDGRSIDCWLVTADYNTGQGEEPVLAGQEDPSSDP